MQALLNAQLQLHNTINSQFPPAIAHTSPLRREKSQHEVTCRELFQRHHARVEELELDDPGGEGHGGTNRLEEVPSKQQTKGGNWYFRNPNTDQGAANHSSRDPPPSNTDLSSTISKPEDLVLLHGGDPFTNMLGSTF